MARRRFSQKWTNGFFLGIYGAQICFRFYLTFRRRIAWKSAESTPKLCQDKDPATQKMNGLILKPKIFLKTLSLTCRDFKEPCITMNEAFWQPCHFYIYYIPTCKMHKTFLSECFLPIFLSCTPRAATTNTILFCKAVISFGSLAVM